MTWTPRKTETRANFLAREEPDWYMPRIVMPWRVFVAGFVCVGLVVIILLLAVIATGV